MGNYLAGKTQTIFIEVCLSSTAQVAAQVLRPAAFTRRRENTADIRNRLASGSPHYYDGRPETDVASWRLLWLQVGSVGSILAIYVAILLVLVAINVVPAGAQTTYLADWGHPDTVASGLERVNLAWSAATDDLQSVMADSKALPLLLTAANLTLPVAYDGGRTAADTADVVFGEGRGTRLLTLLTRYSYNAAAGNGADHAFTIAELDSFLAAFAVLPRSFVTSLHASNRALIFDAHLDQFASQNSELTSGRVVVAFSGNGRAGIRVGDLWSKKSAQFQRLAILHELAHDFIRANGDKLGWRAYWESALLFADVRAHRLGLASGRVSTFARSDPEEDFAECVVAYRFAPRILKQLAPLRYKFLRDRVFLGQQYVSESPAVHG